MDAIELLERDHRDVTKLFERFAADKERTRLVERICDELDVHAQIEEEIFYATIREADAELERRVEESLREHAQMKAQVRDLRSAAQGREGNVEGRVTTLRETVEHHVSEEEGEMFPRVAELLGQRARTDIGRRLQARKSELTSRGASRERSVPRSTTRRRRAKASKRARTTASRVRRGRKRSGARKSARARAQGVR
jgi:iron-sulfur cluster repair protein YtfE (RIC family)